MFFTRYILLITLILNLVTSSVIRADDKNFRDLVINSNKISLVKFYADWCRHCKNLAPVFENLAVQYEEDPSIQIVEINGDKDGKKMAKKYGLEGYPAVYLFKGGGEPPIEYSGSRDEVSYSNFIKAVSGASEGESSTEARVLCHAPILNEVTLRERLLGFTGASIIAFLDLTSEASAKVYGLIDEVSCKIYSNDPNLFVGKVFADKAESSRLKQIFQLDSLPSIIYLPPRANPHEKETYSGKADLESLVNYINSKTRISRDIHGRLLWNAGRILELADYIEEYVKDTYESSHGPILLDKLKSLAPTAMDATSGSLSLTDKDWSMVSYYKKLINKLIEGETDFYQKESTRLSKLLEEAHNLRQESIDYAVKRLNVLRSFISSE